MTTDSMTAIDAHEHVATAAQQHASPELRHIDALAIGEYIRQGDVYLVRLTAIPSGYTVPAGSMQLAPGTSQGSRHCLVEQPGLRALTDPQARDPLLGPVIDSADRFSLVHPEHAHFSLPAGTYQCRYQQDLGAEEIRAVRD